MLASQLEAPILILVILMGLELLRAEEASMGIREKGKRRGCHIEREEAEEISKSTIVLFINRKREGTSF